MIKNGDIVKYKNKDPKVVFNFNKSLDNELTVLLFEFDETDNYTFDIIKCKEEDLSVLNDSYVSKSSRKLLSFLKKESNVRIDFKAHFDKSSFEGANPINVYNCDFFDFLSLISLSNLNTALFYITNDRIDKLFSFVKKFGEVYNYA